MNEIKLYSEGKVYMVTNINNSDKYNRAKADAGFNATQKQILAHYDKLGGYIQNEEGEKIKNGSFWEGEKASMATKQKRKENWRLIEKITQHPIIATLLVTIITWIASLYF